MNTKRWRGPVVFPLLLTLTGVVLLLDNFLLLEFLNVTALWPLLLVVAGAVIVLRGDFTLDDAVRNFGVTRGSVESAILEVSSGEVDVVLRDLERPERLIAGRYAANTRPALRVQDDHAEVRLDRAATPWFNFADWELGLARDLPWQVHVSTSLGQVQADLTNLIVEGGVIATGIGDIRVTCPQETLTPLQLQSSLGGIQVIVPLGAKTRIQVEGPRTLTVRVDERRFALADDNLYVARNAEPDAPLVDITVRGTFGDVYLV